MRDRGRRVVRDLGLPIGVLGIAVLVTVVAAQLLGRTITWGNGSDIATDFADYGPITLAVGLSMLVGEFDLSTPSMYVLGGVVAISCGHSSPLLGLLAAFAVGLGFGLVQGTVIARLGISSVQVTLAGYLVLGGAAYLITNGTSLSYTNYAVGTRLSAPILTVLSLQSLIAVGAFVVIGSFLRFTRIGPELRAVGGDRRAARVAGVPVRRVLVGVFATSGVLAAVSGALVNLVLAYAAPLVAFSPLEFGVTAAIFGGITLTGGRGTVLGVAIGVIALSVVQEGLVIAAASDATTNIVTGSLLGCVALITAREMRFAGLREWVIDPQGARNRRRAGPGPQRPSAPQ